MARGSAASGRREVSSLVVDRGVRLLTILQSFGTYSFRREVTVTFTTRRVKYREHCCQSSYVMKEEQQGKESVLTPRSSKVNASPPRPNVVYP